MCCREGFLGDEDLELNFLGAFIRLQLNAWELPVDRLSRIKMDSFRDEENRIFIACLFKTNVLL